MRKRHRSRRRRSLPLFLGGMGRRRFRHRARRRNPDISVMGLLGNPRRRRHHRRRRNPGPVAAIKGAFKPAMLINTAGVAGGFILGAKLTPMINKPAIMQKARRFTGLIHVALGALIAVLGKKDIAKAIGGGVAASGVYDILAVNVPQLAIPKMGSDLEESEQNLIEQSGLDIVGGSSGLDIVSSEDEYDI